MNKQVNFSIKEDKNYTYAYVTGLEVSSISPDRLEIDFFCERATPFTQIIKELNPDGSLGKVITTEPMTNSSDVLIEKSIKATIAINNGTVTDMIKILQEYLAKSEAK